MTRDEILARARELGYDAGTIDISGGGCTLYVAWPRRSEFDPYAYLLYGADGRPKTLRLFGLRQTGLTREKRVALLAEWLEENAPVAAIRPSE